VPAADKIRSEMAATTGDLSSRLAAERASAEQLAATSDELRLKLGGVKQQMAKNAAELQRERQIAADLKERVKAINQTYQASGDVLRSELEAVRRTPGAMAQVAPVQVLRSQLGSSSQALEQAEDRLKWVPCCWLLPCLPAWVPAWLPCLSVWPVQPRFTCCQAAQLQPQHPLLTPPPPRPLCRTLAAALHAADKKMDQVRADVRGLQSQLRQAEARPVVSGQVEDIRKALAAAQDELQACVYHMQ
jgi:hypothetical protein